MTNLIVLLGYLFLLICETRSIICIVCTNLNNPTCGDPFSLVGSTYSTLSNQTYCEKSVSVNGLIERSGSGQICSTSDVIGITSIYCCSDKDYCNKATNRNQSILSMIFFTSLFGGFYFFEQMSTI